MPSYPAYRPPPQDSGQTMLDLIMHGGQIQADAARNSGNIWGNAFASIGNTLAGGFTQVAAENERKKQSIAFEAAIKSGDPQRIITVLGPERGPAVITALSAHAPDGMKRYTDRMTLGRDQARGILAVPADMRPAAYTFARNGLIAAGAFKPEELPEDYATATPIISQVANYGADPAKAPDGFTLSPGQQRFGADGRPIASAPPEPPTLQHVETAQGIQTFNPRGGALGPVIAQPRPHPAASGGMGALYSDIDPKSIADAIERGDQPPTITDLGKPAGAAVASQLAKRGFNLAAAATDWKATQKHISSMNSATQLKLTQSINALPELLDTVDSLASQWKGGRFPVLNKANLALAKGGAYGPEVATVANKLDAQIADVNADLAAVYMGGNSPTDHGLALASRALSGDWDERVLHGMVDQARKNVIIRRNSILNTGVAGASEGNPYASHDAPPNAGGPPPAPGGGAPEITATGPNGQRLVLRNGQWVAP